MLEIRVDVLITLIVICSIDVIIVVIDFAVAMTNNSSLSIIAAKSVF